MYWCSGMFKVLTIDSDYLFDWFWLWKTWWTRRFKFLYKNLPRYLWIDEEEKVGHPKKRKKNQRCSNRPPHLRLTNLRSWLSTLFSPIMFGPFHQIYLDVLGYFTLEKEFFIFLSGKFFCKDIFWSQTSNLISAAMRLYLRNQNE